MKNRTKANQNKSLENSSGGGTSVKAAVITILVLHVAFGLGLISQGCKKETPGQSAENRKSDAGSGGAASSSQNMGSLADAPRTTLPSIPPASRANDILQSGGSGRPTGPTVTPTNRTSAPTGASGGYQPVNSGATVSNQTGRTTAFPGSGSSSNATPRLSTDLPINEAPREQPSATLPPPATADAGDDSGSFYMGDSGKPRSGLQGTYGNRAGSGSTGIDKPSATDRQSGSTAQTGSTANYKTVTIQKGDYIGRLAKEYGSSTEAILKANPQITDVSKIQIGWEIRIPVTGASSSSSAAGSGSSPSSGTGGSGSTDRQTSAATGSGSVVNYTVKRGDTLYHIGREYGVDWKKIRDFNNMKTADLKVGQELRIPTGQ